MRKFSWLIIVSVCQQFEVHTVVESFAHRKIGWLRGTLGYRYITRFNGNVWYRYHLQLL